MDQFFLEIGIKVYLYIFMIISIAIVLSVQC